MRSCLLVSLLGLSLLSACKKDENNYYQYVPPYSLSGITDLTLRKAGGTQKASLQSNFGVIYNNGEQERVAVSIEGKPAGLYDSISVKNGYPNFGSTLFLADSGVAEGDYTLKMVAQGDKSGRREYPFKLTVIAAQDCASPFVGTYTKISSCLAGGTSSQTVVLSPTVKNRLLFTNLNNNGLQIYVDVTCDQGLQLTVPSQTFGGTTYNGYAAVSSSGTGTGNSGLQLYISSSSGSGCSYSLSR